MYILLSPAKKMRQQPDLLECRGLPAFSADAAKLLAALQSMTLPQLQRLWRCSDALAQRSFALLQGADVAAARTPALLAYDGIQYQYLSPLSLPDDAVEYLQQHLRILSGLYGVLRPLDAVIPYRLEMQAQLCVGGAPDLYAYWGDRIARSLCAGAPLIDLASRESSRSVLPHLPPDVRVITCTFAQQVDDRLLERATLCKMARGEMARYLALNRVQDERELRGFRELGFAYSPVHSDENHYVFIKGGPSPC